MKKRSGKAIETLTKCLNDIEKIENTRTGNDWKAKTMDSFIIFFGSDSALTQRLEKTYFTDSITDYHSRDIGTITKHIYNSENKNKFRNLISNAIDYIKQNGIKEDFLTTNFLNQYSNKELISGIIAACVMIFGIGSYIGSLSKDREIFQTEKKIEKLQKKYENLKVKYDAESSKLKITSKK